MVTQEQIEQAVKILADSSHALRIILFGSYARGDAREDSDVDLLVIEPTVTDKAREMVRLRRALRQLRIPVDVLVFSQAEAEKWAGVPGTPLYWAHREGRVLHESRH
jgi:predicted nucleotidyltransferase